MNFCEKIREQLWDLDENYVGSDADKIKEHLENCEACRNQYKKIKDIKAGLKECKEETPTELEETVLYQIFGKNEKKKNKRKYLPIGAIAAAVILFSVFTVYNSALFNGGDKKTEDYSGEMGDPQDVYNSLLQGDLTVGTTTTYDRFVELEEFDFSDCKYSGKFPGEISILYFVEPDCNAAVLDILKGKYYSAVSDGRIMYMGKCDEHDASAFEGIYRIKYTRSGDIEPKFFAVIMETE